MVLIGNCLLGGFFFLPFPACISQGHTVILPQKYRFIPENNHICHKLQSSIHFKPS